MSCASRVRWTEWAVEYVPVPATTVPRSATVSTATRKSSSRSSSESVGLSPVVPATTKPSEPLSSRWFARSRNHSKSIVPSSLNGVTIAVRTSPSTAPSLDVVEPTLRDARKEDSAAIADLLGQLGYPTDADAVEARIERLVAAGDRVMVADAGGSVVGLAALHVSASLEYDEPAGKLAALVVDESRRGSGIGRSLVTAMEAEARRRGCAVFFLTTAERRGDAHAFYERLGLERTGRRYAKR